MPMYEFVCEKCGHADTFFRKMDDSATAQREETCPMCGESMFRDFQAEAAGPHIDKPFQKPIEMHSIALNHPDDIRDFQKRNPDATIQDGVPIAHNRAEKLRILSREGYVEKN